DGGGGRKEVGRELLEMKGVMNQGSAELAGLRGALQAGRVAAEDPNAVLRRRLKDIQTNEVLRRIKEIQLKADDLNQILGRAVASPPAGAGARTQPHQPV